ncbi:Hypothetical protein FKW44_002360 [Caligus rogercresseyi]|uniref:Uncharacterized protein n=1 Tax=Caligus rogercresseyi TaxID=217165 RepID=A0A7T8KK43_CALRO|nr:Hypothetical protein FKW44_002360 [Caligus rogercresseyi]
MEEVMEDGTAITKMRDRAPFMNTSGRTPFTKRRDGEPYAEDEGRNSLDEDEGWEAIYIYMYYYFDSPP